MNNRPSFGRPLTVRGHDLFDTPPIALDPLFVHEPLLAGVDTICEPFCGKGNLVLAMRARGITVHASDILDRGCPDSTVLDFRAMTRKPCDVLLSNCPYAGAMDFIEHALDVLQFRVVVLLLSPSFLFTAGRVERLHKPGHLRRVHFLAERLQGMHDAAHLAAGGKTASQPLVHAWFTFERDYCGPATINSVSLKRPTDRMPWAQLPMSAPSRVREAISNEPAHSPFGGSVAARIMGCPASVGLVAKVPANLRKTSAHAERGTTLHAGMPQIIERECALEDLIGKKIGEYTVTRDDDENALRPACAYVDTLLNAGADYYLEQRVKFPTIDGAFGTADLIARVGNVVHLVDFKFGSGVQVLALYPDGDEDVLNAQLMFYAAAARHSLPEFFAGADEIVLTILQPQSIDPEAEMVSSVTVSHAELDELVTVFRAACTEALTEAPRLTRGDHCRFCPARPICPAHTGPLLDLAQFNVPTPPRKPYSREDYGKLLSEGLALFDEVKEIGKALHDQAKEALHAGTTIPGYTLTEGRAVRQWANEATAPPDLLKLGLARDDVLVELLRSPKQVEMRAKARGVKVPRELISSHPSGVSLVRIENARTPVPGRAALVDAFAGTLAKLITGENENG